MGYWSAVPEDGKGLSVEIRAMAAHELGHVLVHSQVGLYGSAFFAEGIAFYLQGREAKDPWLEKGRPLISSHVRELCESARTVDEFREGAVFLSYLIALDRQDPTRIKRLLTVLSQERLSQLRNPPGKNWPDLVETAFQQVYGKTVQQLEHAWRLKP
jgi:hypothetical protein